LIITENIKSEEWTRLAFYRGKLKIRETMKDEKN